MIGDTAARKGETTAVDVSPVAQAFARLQDRQDHTQQRLAELADLMAHRLALVLVVEQASPPETGNAASGIVGLPALPDTQLLEELATLTNREAGTQARIDQLFRLMNRVLL